MNTANLKIEIDEDIKNEFKSIVSLKGKTITEEITKMIKEYIEKNK
jgi:antitoxin component of RelBE/YafQ-DinJ toxin-antitoxin module